MNNTERQFLGSCQIDDCTPMCRSITIAEILILVPIVSLLKASSIIAKLNTDVYDGCLRSFISRELKKAKDVFKFPKRLPEDFAEKYLLSPLMEPDKRPAFPKKTMMKNNKADLSSNPTPTVPPKIPVVMANNPINLRKCIVI